MPKREPGPIQKRGEEITNDIERFRHEKLQAVMRATKVVQDAIVKAEQEYDIAIVGVTVDRLRLDPVAIRGVGLNVALYPFEVKKEDLERDDD